MFICKKYIFIYRNVHTCSKKLMLSGLGDYMSSPIQAYIQVFRQMCLTLRGIHPGGGGGDAAQLDSLGREPWARFEFEFCSRHKICSTNMNHCIGEVCWSTEIKILSSPLKKIYDYLNTKESNNKRKYLYSNAQIYLC
jgi:hypothetical protein